MSPTEGTLAPYAANEATSKGRQFAEAPPAYRSEYQRDRDRIIHSSAFRRLVYKTQVFVNHEGDLYRTRLTHSIEVAQIARSIARALGLNETLTEAICLAHDLGHTPFGHAGQDALNQCMREYGGFEHNLQSLRVVDVLEECYAEFPGLNLTFEAREGILKHCSLSNARQLGELGERFIRREQPTLEAQIANLADEIAYNNHDLDDGLRAGLITLEGLKEIELFRRHYTAVHDSYPSIAGRRLIHEIVRRMINQAVTDVIQTSQQALTALAPADSNAVRANKAPLVQFSDGARAEQKALKSYLFEHVYRHYRVLRMTNKAEKVVRELFGEFLANPRLLPTEHYENVQRQQAERGTAGAARVVADYIAGMTDRFAISEYERLFDPALRS